jgi:hypothetical protein
MIKPTCPRMGHGTACAVGSMLELTWIGPLASFIILVESANSSRGRCPMSPRPTFRKAQTWAYRLANLSLTKQRSSGRSLALCMDFTRSASLLVRGTVLHCSSHHHWPTLSGTREQGPPMGFAPATLDRGQFLGFAVKWEPWRGFDT